MTNAFLVTYGGTDRNGRVWHPYKAIVHTADEAIAVINTWTPYGRKNTSDKITVNNLASEKIRMIFESGISSDKTKDCGCRTIKTTGCGAWCITFYPALADTLEEHERIYNEQREKAKAERLRLAEIAKQKRLIALYEQKRGWYHVSLSLSLYVFANRGNDWIENTEYSCDMIADSGINAYNKLTEYVLNNPQDFIIRGNITSLQSFADPTSKGFNFTFLGVKVDGGYSIKKWEEWNEKEDMNDEHTSIRKMYEDFEALQHNAFYELYSEEDWDYCNTHTLEQAIEEDYQPTTHF